MLPQVNSFKRSVAPEMHRFRMQLFFSNFTDAAVLQVLYHHNRLLKEEMLR